MQEVNFSKFKKIKSKQKPNIKPMSKTDPQCSVSKEEKEITFKLGDVFKRIKLKALS